MRVLVTSSAEYVGSNIACELLDRDIETIILDEYLIPIVRMTIVKFILGFHIF